MDYIFNYKNNLSTNQLGFDTIEINLVIHFFQKLNNGFLGKLHSARTHDQARAIVCCCCGKKVKINKKDGTIYSIREGFNKEMTFFQEKVKKLGALFHKPS